MPVSAQASFGRVKIAAFEVHLDLSEIFRPIAERARLVQLGTANRGRAVRCVTREPVQIDQVRRQFALGHKGLQRQQERSAVRFDDDLNAAFGGIGQNRGQRDLRRGCR